MDIMDIGELPFFCSKWEIIFAVIAAIFIFWTLGSLIVTDYRAELVKLGCTCIDNASAKCVSNCSSVNHISQKTGKWGNG